MSPEALAFLIGLVMPAIVSLLKRASWPDWAKLALAALVSLAVGGLSAFVSGQVELDEPERIFTSAAAAFASATGVYKVWFETTGFNHVLTDMPL